VKRILIIQTAFIGDVILATPLLETLHRRYPEAQIDVLLRRGAEGLLEGNPCVHRLWIWDKRRRKYRNLFALLRQVRREKYELVINLQRFASTGFFSVLAGAKCVVGFDKNPFSRLYSRRVAHRIGSGGHEVQHEVQRNLKLVESLVGTGFERPRLYPQPSDYERVAVLKGEAYVTISPTSVWFTKQLPADKWAELIALLNPRQTVYLLGSRADREACEQLALRCPSRRVVNLAGELSLLQSAALMRDAAMSYVNDSAPLHLASAMNAPTTAVFCSTVPAFGFGPLADHARIVEATPPPACRPCGLHGFRRCPKGDFLCARVRW
jgi:heptosyltransferase-2